MLQGVCRLQRVLLLTLQVLQRVQQRLHLRMVREMSGHQTGGAALTYLSRLHVSGHTQNELYIITAGSRIVKAITASFTAMEDKVEEEESDEDIEESEEEENLVIPELDDKEGEGEMFGGWVWDERSLREELD